jgi:hypothetical protein
VPADALRTRSTSGTGIPTGNLAPHIEGRLFETICEHAPSFAIGDLRFAWLPIANGDTDNGKRMVCASPIGRLPTSLAQMRGAF